MNYQQLADDVAAAPLTSRAELNRLLMSVSTPGAIAPAFEQYAAEAETYTDFFNALYADDAQKFTSPWAAWAKLTRKSWINRFEPRLALANLRLKSDGLPISFESGIMLAPTGSRDSIAHFSVFDSKGFNVEAADFVTSIGGSFTCAGYDFTGIYGLYKYRGSVILETWEEENPFQPSADKGACSIK